MSIFDVGNKLLTDPKLIYEKIGQTILKNPNIIRPHVKVKDITELNFQKMKDMGMEKIIFSRDNVLKEVVE